jgi:hypothetical protein
MNPEVENDIRFNDSTATGMEAASFCGASRPERSERA